MRYICILCLLGCWPTYGQPPALKWPADLNAIPEANGTDIGTVEALVNSVLARGWITARVRAFRFVPLETVKRIDLIASFDTSGRGMFNAFIAVWPSQGTYGHAILPSDVQTVLARDVVDLDGTGVHEVVAGRSPGGYQGVSTIPIPWYSVHALRQGKWVDVSDRYPQLYQADLSPRSSLIFRVADAALSGDKEALQLYKACSLFVLYKYDRTLLHIRDQGLAVALDWAESDVPNIRLLAVETLSEIADPRAISVLRKLAQDPRVGILAKGALDRMGAGVDRK